MRGRWLFFVLLGLAPGLVWAAERGVVLVYDAQGAQARSATARTALVIGNGSYRRAPLRNPVNDATDVADALKELGFEVVLSLDVDKRVFKKAMRKFRKRLQRRGGVGLFYYAGHGIQVRGRNYLIPVGADIETEADVEFAAVDAGQVLRYMDEAEARLNIVILDACRDNPYERSWRSVSRGLKRLELPQGPLGSLLAYSTAPGKVAADGTGRNSPFTKHLLRVIRTPGLRVEDVFKRTRIGVKRETDGRQIPWSESSLVGDFYFRSATLAATEPPVVVPRPPTPKKARLTVRSNVTGDTLYIEGQARGPTGPTAYELAPGRHTVRVEKPGYGSWERTLTLAAGERETVRAELSRVRPAPAPPRVRPSSPSAGETWTEPVTGMEFVRVPAGCFQMGSEKGDADEKPVHRVCVKGYWLGRHEVTQGEWQRVMGSNPAHFKKGDDYPVETVSWKDAQAFIGKLNREGRGGYGCRARRSGSMRVAAAGGPRPIAVARMWIAWPGTGVTAARRPTRWAASRPMGGVCMT